MLGHWTGDEFKYELQIEEEDKVTMFPFKSPRKPQKVTTLAEAQTIECPCKQMGNIDGVSRLFGEFSEPVERVKEFMNFEGVTKTGEVYKILEKGKVDIIKTEMGATFNFDSDLINGRWLLRTLPNIFNKEFIEGPNMQLFWKPGPDSIKTEASEQISPLIKVESQMTSQLLQIDETKSTFNTVVAAEGRWTDKFGNTFIYTKDFLQTLFTNMQESLKLGKLGVDMNHNKKDNGKMTELQLLDEPYAHIIGRGFYDGSISNSNGVSIDAEFEVFFDPKANAYIPVNGVTKRVSLVASPACKVCKFIPK